jgi:glycosyltransferase involved in cell wall biosynthesis
MIQVWEVPRKGKRVLMIAPDVIIDRRILIEAESLVDDGYEVYLLAGWDAGQADLFEVHGKVCIERIRYEGIDQRLYLVYKLHGQAINFLNRVSSTISRVGEGIAVTGTALINKPVNKVARIHGQAINFLNRVSSTNSRVGHALAMTGTALISKTVNRIKGDPRKTEVVNKSVQNCQTQAGGCFGVPLNVLAARGGNLIRHFLCEGMVLSYRFTFHALLVLFVKMNYLVIHVIARGVNFVQQVLCKGMTLSYRFTLHAFLVLSMKLNNLVVERTGRLLNRCVEWIAAGVAHASGFSGYEYVFFKKALFYRPDIIHVHDLPMLCIGARIKKQLGIPLIYDMHEYYPEQPRLTPEQQASLRTREKKDIHKADVIITVNSMLGAIIKRDYELPRIDIIQNAVLPGAQYNMEQKYDRFREDYPHLKSRMLLLYQGVLAENRNLEIAIQGMSLLKDDRWVLLIMGYGDYRSRLVKMVFDFNANGRVLFVPAKPQEILLTYTASADVGLIPYPTNKDINTHYVSPNKLYEFITTCTPIISNRLPYVQKVVEQNGFGLVADLNSPETFSEAIFKIDVLQLQIFRNNMRSNGWKYSWNEEKNNLLSIYESQLKGNNP